MTDLLAKVKSSLQRMLDSICAGQGHRWRATTRPVMHRCRVCGATRDLDHE